MQRTTFLQHFKEAHVEPYPAGEDPKGFFVTRTVLRPDWSIVEITENVGRNGFYSVVSEKIIYESGLALGLTYISH